jgi:hypothetical protein
MRLSNAPNVGGAESWAALQRYLGTQSSFPLQ